MHPTCLLACLLARRAEDWPWSSAKAHLTGEPDGVVALAPVAARIDDFRAFLGESFDEGAAYAALRRSETTGRPIGGGDFLESLEAKTDRTILPRKPGPKPESIQRLNKVSP